MTGVVLVSASGCRGGGEDAVEAKRRKFEEFDDDYEEEEQKNQISLVALVLAALRRSMVSSCRLERQQAEEVLPVTLQHMEIGWPTNVQHVAHVTFDRFNGFLGLPVEFEVEVPIRSPSASASVFGVSAESMQCCYDSRGNSVPTILLLMQERLYVQGGLKAEGIFRINPENSQEEHVRDQLNKGVVPEDIDVHCLAGLIKAWFRELPEGVLDGLSPEEVLQCNTEEEFVELVKLLMPTQAALLNWAIELMADVVEEEETNKMNARNIAMVFAPNMTQMSDPLTALMHAVQVMNLLKALILKTLRDREEAAMSEYTPFSCSPSSDQQDEDDFSNQKDMDMSGELREESSDEEHQGEASDESGRRISTTRTYSHHYSSVVSDDDDSLKDIEECFLRQLEWKKEDGDIGKNNVKQSSPSHGQATRLSSASDLNIGSCISMSESKQGRSSTKSEADSVPFVNGEVISDTKKQLQHKENEQMNMVLCKWMP